MEIVETLIDYEDPKTGYKTLFFVDENGIVNTKSSGLANIEVSKKEYEILKQYYQRTNKKLRVCLDAGNTPNINPDVRKFLSDVYLSENSIISKVAITNTSFFMRNLMNLYARISKVTMKVFKEEEDAISWLLIMGKK